MPVNGGLANPHGDSDDKNQERKNPDVGLEIDMGDSAGQQLPFRHGVTGRDQRLLPGSGLRQHQQSPLTFGFRNSLTGLDPQGVPCVPATARENDVVLPDLFDLARSARHNSGSRRPNVHSRDNQQSKAGKAQTENPLHHGARPEEIRHPAAESANHTGRKAEDGRRHARHRHRHAVYVDVVGNQPLRERHEATENQEVIQAEAPDPGVLQRLQEFRKRFALRSRGDPIFCEQEEDNPHEEERQSIDFGQHSPPLQIGPLLGRPVQQEGSAHASDGRPGISGPEDSQSRSLLFLGKPDRGVGDPDREAGAGQSEPQTRQYKAEIRVHLPLQIHQDRRAEQQQAVDRPATVLVGQQSDGEASERARQHGDSD